MASLVKNKKSLLECPWYHGPITRISAELSVSRSDGDFLVRDCISSPGDYVLTCRWKHQTLHFRMNRADSGGEFQFEDEAFDTVPELIAHHVDRAVAISQLTGAVIRYYHTKSWFFFSPLNFSCPTGTRYPGTRPEKTTTLPWTEAALAAATAPVITFTSSGTSRIKSGTR